MLALEARLDSSNVNDSCAHSRIRRSESPLAEHVRSFAGDAVQNGIITGGHIIAIIGETSFTISCRVTNRIIVTLATASNLKFGIHRRVAAIYSAGDEIITDATELSVCQGIETILARTETKVTAKTVRWEDLSIAEVVLANAAGERVTCLGQSQLIATSTEGPTTDWKAQENLG